MVRVKSDRERSEVQEIFTLLRNERIEKGLSQQRLAEMAGISRTGLRHIEGLEINPTLFSLLKVAHALDLRLANLLRLVERE